MEALNMKKLGNLLRLLIIPPLFILGVLSNIASVSGFEIGPMCILGPCTPHHTITYGGTVSGLEGTGLTIWDSESDILAITANGSFTFSKRIEDGSSYTYYVTVRTQPTNPTQICTVNNGLGTISWGNVTDISVVCVRAYTVGGTVSGLTGGSVILRNSSSDYLTVRANGGFTFPTPLESGSSYNVTVAAQPSRPPHICTVNNGSGTVSGADITNVSVVCTPITYTISGTVNGLTGTGLVLQNNNTDDLGIMVDGVFTFPEAIPDTYSYSVTVLNQPSGQACTVSNASGALAGADVTDIMVTCLRVMPLFSSNGINWNDYIQGNDILNATDTACNAAVDTACIHAGEVRLIELTGETSCTGITASDALGAFDWICDDSMGTARVISSGLAPGHGLADLLDFSTPAWKENSLTVYKDSVAIETTTPAEWWYNPVDTSGDATVGLIRVIPTDITGKLAPAANKESLVAAPGVVFNGPGYGLNSSIMSVTGKDFIWIEGMEINAAGDDVGIYLDTVRFSVLRDVTIRNTLSGLIGAEQKGLYLNASTNNRFSNVTTSHNGVGIALRDASNGNTFSNVSASNNSGGFSLQSSMNNILMAVTATNNINGILLYNFSGNSLSDVSATNNSAKGINFNSSSDNTLSGVTVTNNATGIYLDNPSANNTFMGLTAANNTSGIHLYYSSDNTFSEVTTTNNGSGINLNDGSGNTFSDVTASNNSGGIRFWYSDNNYFTGKLQVGNDTWDCSVTGGTNPGLVDGVCTNNGSSDAILTTGITNTGSFVAKVTSDDTANTSDINGAAVLTDALSFDWLSFENAYRNWGVDGNIFPDVSNRGNLGCKLGYFYANQTDCEANSGTWAGNARIWDWSLLTTDTVIKDILPLPTGNDTLTHIWSDLSISTFLRNAVEIQDDDIGNENTLCETGETCLYTPNMGAYQGHGNLISAGAFTDGTITGVTLMKYETNGY